MGILDNILSKFKTTEEYIDALTEKIKKSNYIDKEKMLEYLNKTNNFENINYFRTQEILSNVIYQIICYNRPFESSIKMAKDMFDLIVYNSEKNEEIEIVLFYKYFDLYLANPEYSNLFIRKNIFETIYSMFENKNILLSYLKFIIEDNYHINNINNLIEYMTISRQYFVDDIAFYSNILETTKQIGPIERNSKEILIIIKSQLIKIKEMAGSYSIDEELIQEISREVKKTLKEIEEIKTKRDEIDNELKEVPSIIEERIKDIIKKKTQQIEDLSATSKKFITETTTKTTKELTDLKTSLEESLTESAEKVLSDINTNSKNFNEESQKYINIIRELVGYDEKLQNELREKVNSPEIYIPNRSNSILSMKINDKEKKELALSQKDKKALYHEKFDEILNYVIINTPVMLVGPSGTGKSYLIEQICELLNIKMYNLGFISDEVTSFKGYMDANGRFVVPPFYKPFKDGGVCLFEEVDNSESKALLELNKIIGAKGMSPYMFANGEKVTPHNDFRIIATGNTRGDGGSLLYTAREKLDFSIIDRFIQIYYDYDEKLEKSILKNYPEMYEFANAFRNSLKQSGVKEEFSTRKINEIKKELESSIVTLESILETVFINNKRKDTIEQIYDSLYKQLGPNNKILKEFSRVKEKCKGRKHEL